MKCQYRTTDHSLCPNRTACFADPVGFAHDTTLQVDCEREAVDDDIKLCREHLKIAHRVQMKTKTGTYAVESSWSDPSGFQTRRLT